MNCVNGRTDVNTCIPVAGGTATEEAFVFDLTHYTCGNRKICANGFFPLTADLKYKVIDAPRSVGNNTYVVDLLITGVVTYMPYRPYQNNGGCGCQAPCPVSENIWCTISVPWGSATAPVVTPGEVICNPTNLKDCCQITNAMSIVSSFQLAEAEAANVGN